MISFRGDCRSSWSFHPRVQDEFRSLLCNKAAFAKRQANRKLADVVANSKAEQSAIDEAEAAVKSGEEIITMCNIGSYHTRAIAKAVANIQGVM